MGVVDWDERFFWIVFGSADKTFEERWGDSRARRRLGEQSTTDSSSGNGLNKYPDRVNIETLILFRLWAFIIINR